METTTEVEVVLPTLLEVLPWFLLIGAGLLVLAYVTWLCARWIMR